MKTDRLTWGILFLFVGGVILLDNFDVIEFYWRNVWQFWPIILIIGGINILFGKKENNVGAYISLGILLVALVYLFYRGQQTPENKNWLGGKFRAKFDRYENDDRGSQRRIFWNEAYLPSGMENAKFVFHGGGSSLELDGATDSLIATEIHRRYGNFSFDKSQTDSMITVNMRSYNKKGEWSIGGSGNDVKLRLNTNPIWDLDLNMGAGAVDMDLSGYKVRNFDFDGGAAALEIKLGDLLPSVDVKIKTGVADVKIEVPQTSGCRIRSHAGLSVKDYEGFKNLGNGVYETENFNTAAKKIYLNLDGGLTNFEVRRY